MRFSDFGAAAYQEVDPGPVLEVENHHDGYVVRGKSLPVGFTLFPGQYITSPMQNDPGTPGNVTGRYALVMTWSGDLLIIDTPNFAKDPPAGSVLWKTPGRKGAHAFLWTNGNFVIQDAGGGEIATSGTAGTSGARLVFQSEGNLVVYDGQGRAHWAAQHWGSGGFFSSLASLIPAAIVAAVVAPVAVVGAAASVVGVASAAVIPVAATTVAATSPRTVPDVLTGNIPGVAADILGSIATVGQVTGILPSSQPVTPTTVKKVVPVVAPSSNTILFVGLAALAAVLLYKSKKK